MFGLIASVTQRLTSPDLKLESVGSVLTVRIAPKEKPAVE